MKEELQQILNPLDWPTVFEMPYRLKDPPSWVEHIPFAFGLVDMIRPTCIVELGTHTGNSYCSLCQAVQACGLTTACYAIDTWEGDSHAGFYGTEVLAELRAYHDPLYGRFSRLVQSTFDEAVNHFGDASIDLLHIDGMHTYDAVKHDFDTWLPKMTQRGVILFHDVNVRERDFGVWNLWNELQSGYPAKHFKFGHGLGIVGIGTELPEPLNRLLHATEEEWIYIEKFFFCLGSRILALHTQRRISSELNVAEESRSRLSLELTVMHEAHKSVVQERDSVVKERDSVVKERDNLIQQLKHTSREHDDLRTELTHMQSSWSWKITAPLRVVWRLFDRLKMRLIGAKILSHASSLSMDVKIDTYGPSHFRNVLLRNIISIVRDLLYIPAVCRIISSGLVDSSYYLDMYPDIKNSFLNPTCHYFLFGAYEGRNPNPAFDGNWYLSQYPDVAAARTNPLVHYLRFGASEGRNPHPLFDGTCYSKKVPEVLAKRINPLVHYLQSARREGRPLAPEGQPVLPSSISDMLPASGGILPPTPGHMVDIIIPVYRGLAETRRCIESVIGANNLTPSRVVVIDDCTPEQDVRDYVLSLASREGVLLVDNPENKGFVATVNLGMSLSNKHDVVLLNSDTEVAPGWLDRLAAHAYSDNRIGTVTPFSNNATICSYPTMEGNRDLPSGEDVTRMALAFEEANRGRNVEIPTAVGFCMYIRRDCLREVGSFDEATFGKGYGEENDFCLRARKLGWRHLLAADAFVYHRGEASFGSSSDAAKAKALALIRQRYPDYEREIQHFISLDPAKPMRIAATAARYRFGAKPVILLIAHRLGGGVEKHVQDLLEHLRDKTRVLILRPASAASKSPALELTSADPNDALNVTFSTSSLPRDIVEFLKSFGISRIHIHHLFGIPPVIRTIIQALMVPFDFTVHDYYALCPRINLLNPLGKTCGEPMEWVCNHCIGPDPFVDVGDIVWWRASHAWLFLDAQRVICPSIDTARRIQRYYPDTNTIVAYHENPISPHLRNTIILPQLTPADVLRVAVLGVLSKNKGASLILSTVSKIKEIRLSVHFKLIGVYDGPDPAGNSRLLDQTGPYREQDLQELIAEYDPHLILFPSIANETFSYTLTAGLKSRRPLLVPDVGAFPERVAIQPWCWIYSHASDAGQLLHTINHIREKHLEKQLPPPLNEKFKPSDANISVLHDFYVNQYVAPVGNVKIFSSIDVRKQGRINVLAVIETLPNGMPTPCAYIRIVLPLQHDRLHDIVTVRFVKAEEVTNYTADILITHRTAMSTIEAIDRMTDHCREVGMKLIYDLDDDLISLSKDHPEAEFYENLKAPILRLLVCADRVWVSTSVLARRIESWVRHVTVIANEVDHRLWTFPSDIAAAESNEVVKVLYMGTMTHGGDFNIARSALKRLVRDFGKRVSIRIIGAFPSTDDTSWFRRIHIPATAAKPYPAFVRWLVAHNDCQIGIAPLVDNAFNESKSHIKFLDYAALGLATVASDVPAYREVIKHGENGLLVQSNDDAWHEALKSLILDPQRLLLMRRAALAYVQDGSRLQKIAETRLRELEEVAASQPADSITYLSAE